ncbi:hypothetical protein NLI96_g1424 [Meripilus lineatus]|uniref:U4/U6 snRNA-associated-splicing factor PRP24 n=1 Tax=Meripilus lineatus TaxID=2056292 RepID=A0AAD5YMU7_9APHY|nr:hypothetical protein NLI96_g1424 [Physisporinus lineatus]
MDSQDNTDTLLEELSNVLSQLVDNPHDLALLAQIVKISISPGTQEHLESGLEMATSLWPVGDYVWLPLIKNKLNAEAAESAEGVVEILELFEKAEGDYFSIPILQNHIQYLIDRHTRYSTEGDKPEELGELFSTEWTRAAISDIVSKGSGHLTQSQTLWDLWKDWELDMLQNSPEESARLVPILDQMLLDRLKQPHANSDETFQSYSTFTTNYKPPDEYEPLLVQASKLRSKAVKAFNIREPLETSLAQANNSLEGYAYCIASEKAQKVSDMNIQCTLYERAIAEADKRRFAGEANAEEVLRSFWIGYVDFLRQKSVDSEQRLKVFRRATRSTPGSGDLWARYFRFLEHTKSEDPAVSAAFESALSFTPILSDVDQLVPLVLSRAGYEKRKVEAGEGVLPSSTNFTSQFTLRVGGDGFETLMNILTEGIARVRKASRKGDPQLRLEKFMSTICTELADSPENAIALWQDTTKHYKTSYLAWTAYIDVLTKHNLYEDARKIYKDISTKNLDWPEAIWEAWITFENTFGSVQEIEDCLDRVERAQTQVNKRRAKAAEKAAYEAMEVVAEQPAPVPAASTETETPMVVDAPVTTEAHNKRKADEDIETEDAKKPRIEQKPAPLKRDRENCTVFVAELPQGTEEDDLKSLFKDCGDIREVKITPLPNSLVATVEFNDRESVPAALTKDKKRVHGEEIAVHMAWQSTLYVTNFPEKADDALVRELFGKYGTLFDVRWPSKKFKSSRRFCYVQYTSPNSAKAALELHGQELEPGMPLSVYISNPERKKERTDIEANDRELYVAGLSKFTTKEDLEKLFSTYGPLKDVRMALDDHRNSKGFAFIEFEAPKDAVAGLAANNYELKKRRIAVTVADNRVRGKGQSGARKAEARNKSVRVKNLPPGTQEGLLQQALEKHGQVVRVEVFIDKNEAVVELESAAEAGKLLLRPEPIEFGGNVLQIVEETLSKPVASSSARGPAPFVPRSAGMSRPRAGLGSKKNRGGASLASASTRAAPSAPSFVSGGKGQDDFRKMLGSS